MSFFHNFISKVCRKNKVTEGISKKGGGTPNLFTVRQMSFFHSFISKIWQKNKVSEVISKKGVKNENDRVICAAYVNRGTDKPG
jgi:hypothetical protein